MKSAGGHDHVVGPRGYSIFGKLAVAKITEHVFEPVAKPGRELASGVHHCFREVETDGVGVGERGQARAGRRGLPTTDIEDR